MPFAIFLAIRLGVLYRQNSIVTMPMSWATSATIFLQLI
uniref:Uncharacterized protein n=1 Tax=Rhizophora mucronata TaxID=61149 RepID=A0A2P2NK74_RHIMU